MKFIADFHIHSHYSIAAGKNLIPEFLEYWARIKGIDVVGTGDCIHPGWLSELKEKLEPVENGLFRLKRKYRLPDSSKLNHEHIPDNVFFILTAEISNIYKKNGSVRKVHNLCIFPDFNSVEILQERLDKIGNISSNGRPILGLDSRSLLEMHLETSETSFLIPAHIWTPWFSVLGSKSGFNCIEECYEDLTGHLFAMETGLSSDPAMNRLCSFLDEFRLVSNSDAHSPEKLGREANLFDTELTYNAIYEALKGNSGFIGTVEFYPQEGKYHYDGHRKCRICWNPLETLRHNGICTECGKPVTTGVMYRVAELADRSEISVADDGTVFFSITSMPDLIAEISGRKSSSAKSVQKEYFRIIEGIGSEFYTLLYADPEEIRKQGSEILSEGISRLRRGEVFIDEGFDGEFGRITVFNEDELNSFSCNSLFSEQVQSEDSQVRKSRQSANFNISEFRSLYRETAYKRDETHHVNKMRPVSSADEQKQGIEN